eukprot:sb/3471792/
MADMTVGYFPSADPIEMQGLYEEERAKLILDLNEKSTFLDRTMESLKEAQEQHDKELSQLQDKYRQEKDALVDQLRASQAELMESYTKLDTAENETERLEFELSKAEEKYKRQNENLIEQNSALMSALQAQAPNCRTPPGTTPLRGMSIIQLGVEPPPALLALTALSLRKSRINPVM